MRGKRSTTAAAACLVAGVAAGVLLAPGPVGATSSSSTVVTGNGKAKCPAGYHVTGGGATVPRDDLGDQFSTEFKVISSGPLSDGSGWKATAVRKSGSGLAAGGYWSFVSEPYKPKVSAACAR